MRRELEVTLPQLRKPRMVINNIPMDTRVGNLEETIIAQNLELDLEPGEIYARFLYTTKRGQVNTVIEVGPETRRKLQNKLKNKMADMHCCRLPSCNEMLQVQ